MSKKQDHANSFLEQGGKELGYDWNNMPELSDMEMILRFSIHIWDYKGQTEYEYYGVDENEGKLMP